MMAHIESIPKVALRPTQESSTVPMATNAAAENAAEADKIPAATASGHLK